MCSSDLPDPKQVASVIPMVSPRAGQSYANGLQQALHDAAVKVVKPTTDLDLARSAMGVDAAMVARATAKPAAGAAK